MITATEMSAELTRSLVRNIATEERALWAYKYRYWTYPPVLTITHLRELVTHRLYDAHDEVRETIKTTES